jgi:uncharacterized repeat protein (TIGR03803 family)
MKTLHKVLLSVTTFLAVCALLSTASAAATVKVLHTFVGSETGFQPSSGVIFDSSGNLYGELAEWDYATGMVYKLSPNPDGTWSETVLYEFTGGADGAVPEGGLTFDGAGNLYGTATQGFRSSAGVVFKLSPNPDGTWSESVIYSFTGGADGSYPASGVIFDAAGNLYGTASYGGNLGCQSAIPGCGVVFKLAPNPDGSWTQSVLYSFTGGEDGNTPVAGMISDESGNLYGTAMFGGRFYSCIDGLGCGTVFELAPEPDGRWMQSVIFAFQGSGGGEPTAPLIFDRAGNLYGTTLRGGEHQNGVVFQLERNVDGSWTENVLHYFTRQKDGSDPEQGLTLDTSGNLYGTTSYDNYYGAGTAFKLKKDSSGHWTGRTVYQFNQGVVGGGPFRMIFDSAGNLYGTTSYGGSYGYGTVFEVVRRSP